MSFKICHQLELNENSLFLGLIVVVSNRSGLGLMAPDLPAWDAGNLIAKLAMKIALLYWCATSWPCQMRLVGASFTTIWSTYTVVEILILFSLYSGKIIEQKVRRQLSKFLVLSDLGVICMPCSRLWLNWNGHMSFLTGQDWTPIFAGQVLPARTKSGLIFINILHTNCPSYRFS